MKNYFLGKLSDINYKMAIHEGNANRRLASQAFNILLLPNTEVPNKYKQEYNELICSIEANINKLAAPGQTLTKLDKVQNKIASKYLKLLFEIQDELRDD